MDIEAVLKQLRDEHTRIQEAIASLERLGASGVRRRGRPPKWLQEAKHRDEAPAPKRRGRPRKNIAG